MPQRSGQIRRDRKQISGGRGRGRRGRGLTAPGTRCPLEMRKTSCGRVTRGTARQSIKTRRTADFKRMDFTVCELYISTAVEDQPPKLTNKET